MSNKTYTLLSIAAVVLLVFAAVAESSSREGKRPPAPPGPPAWVNTDGSIDPAKMPDEIGVVDEHGQPVVCQNGQKLMVKKEQLIGPPDSPPGLSVAMGASQGRVARHWHCGQNGEAVLR